MKYNIIKFGSALRPEIAGLMRYCDDERGSMLFYLSMIKEWTLYPLRILGSDIDMCSIICRKINRWNKLLKHITEMI